MADVHEVPHGIMFHHFHDGGRHPRQQGSISGEELEAVLAHVGVGNILDPQAWMEKMGRRQLTAADRCLTFDDGVLCQFDVALPVLERHGLRAFWFVYSNVFEGHVGKLELYRMFRTLCFDDLDDFYAVFFQRVFASALASAARAVLEEDRIAQYRASFPFCSVDDVKFRFIRDRALGPEAYERLMDGLIVEYSLDVAEIAQRLWLSNAHLRQLADHGHLIGLHSYSHPTVLAALPPEEQAEEYRKNFAHITAASGQEPVAMAHPCNSYTEQTLDILRRLGIRCGFRSNMVPAGEHGRLNPTPWEMARQDHANIMRALVRSQGRGV